MKTTTLCGLLLTLSLASCTTSDGEGASPPALRMPFEVPPTPDNEDVAQHVAKFVTGDEWRLGSQWRLQEVQRRLEGHVPRPWTVERLAAYAAASVDPKERADLVYLLAASKHSLGLRVAGLSLDHDALVVRTAATEGIALYWLETDVAGGTEQVMDAARAFWQDYRSRPQGVR